MLLIRAVGAGVARYYLSQGPGDWVGHAAADLGLSPVVERPELTHVLQGRHPHHGSPLTGLRPSRRRSGWDLVFAAPKSLSLLAATAGDRTASEAHRSAVRAAVDYLESILAPSHRLSQPGLLAAVFDHETNAGGEPHLHTHVVLANLTRGIAGDWRALGRWIPRSELAGVYHLALRYNLREAGWRLDWRLSPNGLPDLAGVPRAAVRAASSRGQEERAGPRFAMRASTSPRPWRVRAERAGWGSVEAAAAEGRQDIVLPHDAGRLEAVVTTRLLTQGSTFTRGDVVAVLATSHPLGLAAADVARWAERFCSGSLPARTTSRRPRWTTPLARDVDARVEDLLLGAAASPAPTLSPELLAADSSMTSEAAAAAGRLVGSEGVVVVGATPGRSNFVAAATVLGAAVRAWAAEGIEVAVDCRSPLDTRRWAALAGIPAYQAARRPGIVVVDQVDRRPPGELVTLLSSAPSAKFVLVEGGTSLRTRSEASLAYARLSGLEPSFVTTLPDPGPPMGEGRLLKIDPGGPPCWQVNLKCPAPSVAAAAGEVLSKWADARGASPSSPPVMVGLGVAETLALNEAARGHLAFAGVIGGPGVRTRGLEYQEGDRVVAIRAVRREAPCGAVGTVIATDPRRGMVTVAWGDKTTPLGRDVLPRIGHAYAATPRLAARMPGRALVLGPAEGLGLHRSRIAAEIDHWGERQRRSSIQRGL